MIEIIPAIDLIDGACVRLTRGNYAEKKIYSKDPAAMAARFADAGVRRLHCVDLDGAKAGHLVNKPAIGAVCSVPGLEVDLGGGIQSDADIRTAFELGVSQVTAGSIAIYEPETVKDWLREFGPERIILGADFKHGKIMIAGWQESTGFDLMSYLEDYITRGITTVISTDISKDGMLGGSAEKAYEVIKLRYPDLYLIASGGISCMDDIRRLDDMGIDAVIVGKAIYEERITLNEIGEFVSSC